MYYFLIILLLALFVIIFRKKRELPTPKFDNNQKEEIKKFLEYKILFYKNLTTKDKVEFEKRIARFISSKKITGVETDVNDQLKILVACSAIIPTFQFPYFDYPNLKEILIYPSSFNENFQFNKTHKNEGIIGMVGNRSMASTMILQKHALVRAFNGKKQYENVGIHEFSHLLDRFDGEIDGTPERLINKEDLKKWLDIINKEKEKILNNDSDINTYALTNNAEFFAVVCEFFFMSPKKLQKEHTELFLFLKKIFNYK